MILDAQSVSILGDDIRVHTTLVSKSKELNFFYTSSDKNVKNA